MLTAANNGYVYNRTRSSFLANDLRVAGSHWTRMKGLLGTSCHEFYNGKALWIVPSHGVHTIAMRYPIDVVYLNSENIVTHIEEHVQPWRVTPIRMDAESVLELPPHTVANTRTQIGDEIEITVAAQDKVASNGS